MIENDINVLWLSNEVYFKNVIQREHIHEEYFHYVYILEGKATFTIDDQEFEAKENNIVLTPMGRSHGWKVNSNGGLKVLEVKFEVYNKDLLSKLKTLDYVYFFNKPFVKSIFEEIIEECFGKNPLYHDIINVKTMEILLRLIRQDINKRIEEPVKIYPNNNDKKNLILSNDNEYIINQAVTYMKNNISGSIKLEDLARLCNMSKYHFCRTFKKVKGIPPIDYLRKLRIDKAKELLKTSGESLTQISIAVGFSDPGYFSKIFKQNEKMSPTKYMKMNKINQYFNLSENKDKVMDFKPPAKKQNFLSNKQ